MPDFRDYAVTVANRPATSVAEATRVMGNFLRDVMKLNEDDTKLPRDGSRTKPIPIA